MNKQFKFRFQIIINLSFDKIIFAMIDCFNQQSVNIYTKYTNFSQQKPLFTTVTKENKNFKLDLYNYF